jgi:autotransporter translocation and assembly factor TamB
LQKSFVIGLLAAAIIAGLVVAGGRELLPMALRQGAALAGYDLQTTSFRMGGGRLDIAGLRVNSGARPLVRADHISIRYSLRDLLPGSHHRFGLLGIDANGVRVTLTRLANGNFDIPLPSGGGTFGPQRVNTVPLDFTFHVNGAGIELREENASDESAKVVRIDQIAANGVMDSARVTRYRVTGAFHERRPEPFVVTGKIDSIAGFAMHHATAARFPLRALSNYFAQTRDVRILRGGARNFDALLYALNVVPNVAPQYHVSLRLDVNQGRLALTPLAAPIDDVVGRMRVVDNAFFIENATARLAGIPLTIRGGVYDLAAGLTGHQQLRVAVWGRGDLLNLRRAFTFMRDQPISGMATLGVSVQGPVTDPIIIARASGPHAVYRNLPFDNISAGVIYHSNVVAFAPLRGNYAGVAMQVRGVLYTGKHLGSDLALHVSGPASRLPYLDEMLGDEPMVIDASIVGRDLLFHVTGAAASARGTDRVAALLQMDPNGTAIVDPFWLHTPRGHLDGGYVLDRPNAASAYWITATNLQMHAPRSGVFPNLSLPQMPPIDGGVINAAIAGGSSGSQILLAGNVRGAGTSISGVKFSHLSADVAGTLQSAPINRLNASGPWGDFSGSGDFSSQRFVAFGGYRGTFEGLQPLLGRSIVGHGPLSGTVAIAVEPRRIVVVGKHLLMPGATLHGVPIDRASLTLAVEGQRLRIYSAHAHAAGGDVVAAGTFALSAAQNAGTPGLALVAQQLHASQLHGVGLPLSGGTIAATGNLRAGAQIPEYAGGVTISDSHVAQFPIAGNADVHLADDAVGLTRVVGELGGTYAEVNGKIGALSSGSPTYDLNADVPAARVAHALRSFGLPNYMTDGSFNAQLLVAGRSVAPSVSGSVGVPAGEVNGLPFINGRADLAADRSGVSMRGGSVLVGTTATQFSAVSRPGTSVVHVSAPHADLSDFNNFFDTGDTLDGNGRVHLAAARSGRHVTTSGDINVRGFRYRNLPIGDTHAIWSTTRNVVTGSLAVGGSHGLLRAGGSIALNPGEAWLQTLERSRFDLNAAVDHFDLSLWLPALGMGAVPITGIAAGSATVRGRFPNVDLRGNARVNNGTLGPLTLDTAQATVHAANGGIVVDSAELRAPDLQATANGLLGLGADKPIDLNVHAATDRLAQLVFDVSKRRVPIVGAFESTLTVRGTYHAPQLSAGFDASNVRAFGIPMTSLFGEVRLNRGALVLSNTGVAFAKGEATLAGSLPLSLTPLRIGPPNEPMSFDLGVVGLDPAVFDEVFGYNSQLHGVVDAHVGLSGTLAKPQIVGRVSLANGSYVSLLERTPLSAILADLIFDHGSASVLASARAGNGRLQGSGKIAFPDGFSEHGLSLTARALARGAQFDLPAYGNGTLDGAMTLTKKPAEMALLSGNATLSNATLPFASFVKAASGGGGPGLAKIPLAFDVKASAGNNVRVRGSGYGAGLDIGAKGRVHLAGTLATPTLSGDISSTSGTLTYFDRAFRVQQASVAFNAADGVLPTLHAVGTTSVVNPDPDRGRNPYGSAEVTVTIDGQIENLKIGLQSNPPGYTRDQILALIAPFGGFVGGIGYSRQSTLARQQPGGITPLGTVSPIPNVILPQNSSITVGQEAFNIVNAQFTAGLLAPFESTLGQSLGLSSVNFTLGYYGNVGFSATRLLGKAVSAVYAVTFGLPQIQSFGLVLQPNAATAASLNFFVQSGPTKLLQLPGSPLGYNTGYIQGQPLIGNTGFSLTLQHFFW